MTLVQNRPTLRQTLGLWLLFALVLAWPFALNRFWGVDLGFADVHLYRAWALDGTEHGRWPVLDFDWIYPIGALAPIAMLAPLAGSPIYESLFITALFLVYAVIMMELRDRVSVRAAAWWLTFLLLLGPVAVSRLDGVAAALATAALLVVVRRPRLAAALITAAAWVKVAHGAWLFPLLITSRHRVRDVVLPAFGLTLFVITTAFALGGGSRILSFADGQSGRALQIESVAATPFNVLHMLGEPSGLFGNREVLAWEFVGPTARHVAQVLDFAMPLAVIAVGLMTLLALRRDRLPRPELLLAAITATTLALLVFNKVGSAQYVVWLSSPVVLSYALGPSADGVWRQIRGLTLTAAAATQLVFPIGYGELLHGEVWAVSALVVRNIALVTLLIIVTRFLWRAGRPTAT